MLAFYVPSGILFVLYTMIFIVTRRSTKQWQMSSSISGLKTLRSQRSHSAHGAANERQAAAAVASKLKRKRNAPPQQRRMSMREPGALLRRHCRTSLAGASPTASSRFCPEWMFPQCPTTSSLVSACCHRVLLKRSAPADDTALLPKCYRFVNPDVGCRLAFYFDEDSVARSFDNGAGSGGGCASPTSSRDDSIHGARSTVRFRPMEAADAPSSSAEDSATAVVPGQFNNHSSVLHSRLNNVASASGDLTEYASTQSDVSISPE